MVYELRLGGEVLTRVRVYERVALITEKGLEKEVCLSSVEDLLVDNGLGESSDLQDLLSPERFGKVFPKVLERARIALNGA